MTLNWRTSESADDHAHDQEVNLAEVGNPGGAEWASVAPEFMGWRWEILDRWLYEDATTLAEGHVPTEEEAKQAVQSWVSENLPT
jgi:hypothetical protein